MIRFCLSAMVLSWASVTYGAQSQQVVPNQADVIPVVDSAPNDNGHSKWCPPRCCKVKKVRKHRQKQTRRGYRSVTVYRRVVRWK